MTGLTTFNISDAVVKFKSELSEVENEDEKIIDHIDERDHLDVLDINFYFENEDVRPYRPNQGDVFDLSVKDFITLLDELILKLVESGEFKETVR